MTLKYAEENMTRVLISLNHAAIPCRNGARPTMAVLKAFPGGGGGGGGVGEGERDC